MKKKILSLLMAVTLGMTAALSVAPAAVASNPSENPPATPQSEPETVNYAAGLSWSEKVGTPTVTVTENGAIMTDISNSWDSAGVDILPAVKAALGDEEFVDLRLSIQAQITMKSGYEGGAMSVRPLLRGTRSSASPADSEWQNAYNDSLQGDAPLFHISGSNIMSAFYEGSMTLTDGQWMTYETVLKLTKNQIESTLLSEWVLCVDSIGGIEMIDNIEFGDLHISMDTSYVEEEEGTPLYPQPEYDATVWSPVEINLHSEIDYKNPFVATEIDATFTHTDGTVITLPGFWKRGKTWAVRFSPTKAGDWSYAVTCKDTANTGLFAEGVIHAAEATGDTPISKHGFVTIETGKHYYQYADGTPFFWLGDTNWQAPTQVSTTICNYPGCDCKSQFHHIVDDRVEKGFTVYQTYFVPEAGNGERPLWLDGSHERPDTAVFNDKIDEMFAYIHEQGMTIALGLGCHTSTPGCMELDDFLRFTRYVVARYACYSVVWISGQEINIGGNGMTPGYTSFDYYMNASALIESLDGYGHPNSAHMYPMEATHDDAKRLDAAEWHDSWTVQGGHGQVQPKAYYESYYTANGSGHVKPFIESEANYEDINGGPFTGYDLNRHSAWASVLCGSAGFTYGATGIWAGSFSTSGYTGWLGDTASYSYEPWYMGVDKPGSFEVGYMRQFFEAVGPWQDLIPQFVGSRQANFLNRSNCLLSSTEDGSLFVAYFYGEKTKTGKIAALDPEKIYDAYWFNPRTGKFIAVEKGIQSEDGSYIIPEKPDSVDWVFLLTSLGLPEHYEETLLVDLNPTYARVTPMGNAVTPVNVKAVGGVIYSGSPKDSQIMTDHTEWLYDGDPTTIWKPFANRSTQTFLFDLGTAQKLTHIQINPAEGTIIPTFRVEGSNDGKIWTIITDTSLRDLDNPGAGSEPLQGTYRYVKVLLHNAKSVSVSADQLDTLPYKAMFNPVHNQNVSYSVTEISDVLIYSDGEGEPTPEMLVGASVPTLPEPETETEPVTPDEPADTTPDAPAEENPPADTAEPDEDTDDTTPVTPTETTVAPQTEEPQKKGCSSAIGAGLAAITIIVAAAALALRKRKEYR